MEQIIHDNNKKNIEMAVVAYIFFFVPLLTDAKNDKFVKFHVKQGFVLFAIAIAAGIVSLILPFLMFVVMLLQIGITVLAIIGIINAIHGKEEELPIVGHFAEKVTFL